MKKIFIIASFILLTLVGVGCFFYLNTFPIYGYADEISVETDTITFTVFGEGNASYGGYDVLEKEDGTYIFQLYGKRFFGSYFPKTIRIDNKKQNIKRLIQKSFDSDDYETICEIE